MLMLKGFYLLRLRNDKIAIINGDDEHYQHFVLESNNNIIIGQHDSDVKILEMSFSTFRNNI